MAKTREERFWAKVEKTDDCWLWLGATSPEGFGRFRSGTWETSAPRYAYRLLVGELAPTELLHHACDEPRCVRPDHMFPVTPTEHALLIDSPPGINARKTKCIHGHPLSGKNLYVDAEGGRRCRACRKRIISERTARFKGPRRPNPSKIVLKIQMERMSFVELGEYYGVTDTAVRKWARKYGLK